MSKFKTDKLELLKVLQDLVSEELNNSKMNIDLESEVAEFLTEVIDKRRSRRLKSVKKVLSEWIEELEDQKRKRTKNVIPNISF